MGPSIGGGDFSLFWSSIVLGMEEREREMNEHQENMVMMMIMMIEKMVKPKK